MGALVIVSAWPLAMVQDLGRRGRAHEGIAPSGAADALSLRVGNRLVGNRDGAPGIEFTLRGGEIAFEGDAVVALAGAPMEAAIEGGAGGPRDLPRLRATFVRSGERLRLGACAWGARAYLCVAGGIDVPPVLGSASTLLRAGLGGFLGRALASGDRLPTGPGPARAPRALAPRAAAFLDGALRRPTVRAVPGAQAEAFGGELAAFFAAAWTVTDRSDRMGLRLSGPRLVSPGGGAMVTEGMPAGAVEVPGDGQPIVLGPDRPVTGGYPVVACAATADHPRLGQARPREVLRFEATTPEAAREALRALETRLDAEVPPA